MLLSRTRQKISYSLKKFIYDKLTFQEMIDLRDKYRLEDETHARRFEAKYVLIGPD